MRLNLDMSIQKTIFVLLLIKTHKPMKKLNYDKLMALKPTIYNGFRNTLGQLVQLAEHPTRGDEYPVIAIFRDQKVAFCTDFFDTSDMYKGSDYEPINIAGDCICKFEL